MRLIENKKALKHNWFERFSGTEVC